MKRTEHISNPASTLTSRVSTAITTLLVLGLIFAAPASAAFEQVATFSEGQGFTEISVNTTGAGGVPVGAVYAAGKMFSAKGEFLKSSQTGAVDQATGNVYQFVDHPAEGIMEVRVYSADGSLITHFGEAGANGESILEGPEKFHETWRNGIAVDNAGTVYVSDLARPVSGGESRVMVFKPQSPDDYEHYVYTGHANDVAYKSLGGAPQGLAVDDASNLYIQKEEVAIYEFSPGNNHTPVCEYQVPSGGLTAITVNPVTGEVFYFSSKNRLIHRMSACNAEGEFEETGTIAAKPKTEDIYGLAFNPSLAYEASRPPGILYAADRNVGEPENSRGIIFAPAEVRFPSVESESVSSVTSTTATLGAQINPEGSATRYTFQYIAKAAYEANAPGERFAGASKAPLASAVLGAGQEALSAAASLVGLQPDTEYHYRVIATSHCEPEDEEALCEDSGEDQTFRTFPTEAPGLADNRAWELVSPVQKNGGEVFPLELGSVSCEHNCNPGFSAPRYPMQSSPDGEAVVYMGFPFSTKEGSSVYNEYVSKRTASGWQTTILAPALMGPEAAGEGYRAFNAELTLGVLAQVAPSLTPDAPFEFANLYTQPTADPSALSPLLEGEPPNRSPGGGPSSLRLTYGGASADLSRIFFSANDALTGATPFAPEAVDGGADIYAKANLYESVGGQLQLVNVLPGNAETEPGASFGGGLESDVPRSISSDGRRVFWSDGSGQVYVRLDGESTIAIPDPGRFLTASEDGSKVLLDDGHIYDLDAEALTDLTEGKGGFRGVAGQSEDLSHIYFVDSTVLTGEEENERGAKAQVGKPNLYSWRAGKSAFVATLNGLDPSFAAAPGRRSAEASLDGRWLAFASFERLTGYDNLGGCSYGGKIQPCPEVFLYDSASGELRCPSCNPSGTPPLGSISGQFDVGGARLPSTAGNPMPSLPQPRYLTESGRLYFDTTDSLVPSDTNGGVVDVYQYEPEGVGTCTRQGGCVSLISSGHDSSHANFLAMDPTGKNVFFTSRDQLVLPDRDDLIDLYDAREGGGIASETETSRGECQGEACAPSIAAPNDPTPGSSSFEGPGNVDEQKAAKKHKHKKRRHGKKAHRNRAHKEAASHNRGGAR